MRTQDPEGPATVPTGSKKVANSRRLTGTYPGLLVVPGDLQGSPLVPFSDTVIVKRSTEAYYKYLKLI